MRRVERRLQAYFAHVELVRLDLGGPNDGLPLLGHLGIFADAPTFHDRQAESANYRREGNRPPK